MVYSKRVKTNNPLSTTQEQEAIRMSTQAQARALMMRHSMMVKNRQQSMLTRSADEVGVDVGDYCSKIQGKVRSDFRVSYARSGSTMS